MEGTLAHRNRSDFCDLRLRCPSRTPEIARFPKQEKAMPHCDLRVRWKVASDLRFRAAISGPKTPSFCGISGDLAQSTRKSLAIAIVRFWCAKEGTVLASGFWLLIKQLCSVASGFGFLEDWLWQLAAWASCKAFQPCGPFSVATAAP